MKACSRWLSEAIPPEADAPHDGIPMPAPSIQIPLVELDARFSQKGHQLFSKRFLPMVLLLIGDVGLDRLSRGGADGEYRIALLPMKVRLMKGLTNP